jgi:hypothetical protein
MATVSHPARCTLAFLGALAMSVASAAPVNSVDSASGEFSSDSITNTEVYRAGLDSVEATSSELIGGAAAFGAKGAAETPPVRAKAQASAKTDAPLQTQQQEISAQALDRASEAAAPDPLRSALRTLVNVQRESGTATGPTRTNQNSTAQRPADAERDPLDIEIDAKLQATAVDIKAAAADVVRKVFNPTIDDRGRTSFSVAGIDGFQLESNGTSLALGFNDKQVGNINYGAQSNPSTPEISRPTSPKYTDPNAINPLRDVIEFVNATIEHPLTWLVVAIVLIGRIAFGVASARAERRNRIRVPSRRTTALAK